MTEYLENIVKNEGRKQNNSRFKNIKNSITNYIVDTTAAWTFYTPTFATMEYLIAGMESEEILKSRLMAAGVQALVMRPYGKFREYWAKKWNANAESSRLKKFLVDTSALSIFQAPLYSAILYFSDVSLEEGLRALPVGILIGAASGRPYGYWLDKWRKIWGKKPTLSK